MFSIAFQGNQAEKMVASGLLKRQHKNPLKYKK